MSFDPYYFLDLSVKLYNDSNYNEESKYRTSISRAYYAAFLISRNYLESKGQCFDPKKENVHVKVYTQMKKINRKLGLKLKELRESRNNADYDTNMNFEKPFTMYTTGSASNFINQVRKLP